ncbi:Catabolite control protein A OS=Ureibacillus acetophenoni OX=614649 GN=SAMN05877842_102542 PE=4 SV=1 [Ureibacillus acetophenoni]
MLGKQVDGIVMMGDAVTDKLLHAMKHSPAPIVLAGSVDESNELPSVNIDYFQASYEAIQLLISNGHKRIAFILGPLAYTINSKYKLEAYKKALQGCKY